MTNPDAQAATLNLGYTYTASAAPMITGINPMSGPIGGGNTVTITGTGFGYQPTVTFASSSATVQAGATSTTINVTAPAHAMGSVTVPFSQVPK